MKILHLDLQESQGGKIQLSYFWDNPFQATVPYSFDINEIDDLIEEAENRYYIKNLQARQLGLEAIGKRLYDWLDTGDRRLPKEVSKHQSEGMVIAISTSQKFAHLPWELLFVDDRYLVERNIIPVRWVKDKEKISTENKPENRALNLLFMATEPENSDLAQLPYENEEARILETTKRQPLFLQVEESGCLSELKHLVKSSRVGRFDVFHGEPLPEFSSTNLTKKLNQLKTFKSGSPVDSSLQTRAIKLADGNSRLLEWLDKIIIEGTINQELILQRLEALEADKKELREQVLAEELFNQSDGSMRKMLAKGLIFEIPVPREAISKICQGISKLEDKIDRAIRLGLLSVSPDRSLRVPRILPVSLPSDTEALSKQGAEVLYSLWWNPPKKIDEITQKEEGQATEIHRLALEGKVKEIAVEVGDKLTKRMNETLRYGDAKEISERTLILSNSIKIRHNLALTYYVLGESDEAEELYKTLINSPFRNNREDRQEKANIFQDYASFLRNKDSRNLKVAKNYLKESLQLNQQLGERKREAWNWHKLGKIEQYKDNYEQAKEFYYKSIETAKNITDLQLEVENLHFLGMAEHILDREAQEQRRIEDSESHYREAINLTEEALKINNNSKIIFNWSSNLF